MKKNVGYLASLLMLLLFSSCAKEYDLSEGNLDTTIAFGGDSLTLPIGNTKPIYLSQILNIDSLSFLEMDANGNYSIVFKDSLIKVIDMPDIRNSVIISPIESNSTFDVTLPVVAYDPLLSLPDIEYSIDKHLELKIPFSFDNVDEIKRIDSLLFEKGNYNFQVIYDKDIHLSNQPEISIEIAFDDDFLFFNDETRIKNNVFTTSDTFDGNNTYTLSPSLDFKGLKFNWDEISVSHQGTLYVSIDLKLSFLIAYKDMASLSGQKLTFNITYGSSELLPDRFYGVVDYKVDPIVQEVAFSEIPEFMKSDEVSLDFYNPHIDLSLASNAGLSLNCNVVTLPLFNGVPSEDRKLDFNLWFDKSSDPDYYATTSFWIADKMGDTPEGYNFVEAPVGDIIEKIPDCIQVTLNAVTKTNEQHMMDFNTDYGVKMFYEFNIPFSFGESLVMPFRDTLKNIPSLVTTLLKKNVLNLKGEFESLIPLRTEVSIIALDAYGSVINNVVSTVQVISPCESNSTPSITPINLTIKSSSENIPDITSLILNFRITSGVTPGLQINKNSYLKAKVLLSLPGGFIINLDDVNSENNQ